MNYYHVKVTVESTAGKNLRCEATVLAPTMEDAIKMTKEKFRTILSGFIKQDFPAYKIDNAAVEAFHKTEPEVLNFGWDMK